MKIERPPFFFNGNSRLPIYKHSIGIGALAACFSCSCLILPWLLTAVGLINFLSSDLGSESIILATLSLAIFAIVLLIDLNRRNAVSWDGIKKFKKLIVSSVITFALVNVIAIAVTKVFLTAK